MNGEPTVTSIGCDHSPVQLLIDNDVKESKNRETNKIGGYI